MKTKTILATIIALSLSTGAWAAGKTAQPETEAGAAAGKSQQEGATQVQPGMTESQPTEAQTTAGTYQLRASDVIGKDVKNRQGETIGEIDDLIIRPDNTVAYAVIGVGGFLGMGEKMVTVPYDELQVDRQQGQVVYYNATKEELEAKPEFTYKEGESLGRDLREQERIEQENGEASQKEKQG